MTEIEASYCSEHARFWFLLRYLKHDVTTLRPEWGMLWCLEPAISEGSGYWNHVLFPSNRRDCFRRTVCEKLFTKYDLIKSVLRQNIIRLGKASTRIDDGNTKVSSAHRRLSARLWIIPFHLGNSCGGAELLYL